MQKVLQALAMACALVQVSAIAQPITLSGSVKNQQGNAVVGATVRLLNAQQTTGTDAQGNFSFAASPVRPRSQGFSANQPFPTMQLQQGKLSLQLTTPIQKLQLSATTLAGRQVARSTHTGLKAGMHEIALFTPAQLATEALVVTVNSDGVEHSLLLPASQSGTPVRGLSAMSMATAALAVPPAPAVIDTLRVTIGSVTKNMPISSYSQSDVAVVINYTPSAIPELPYKSIAEQKAAKDYFKSLVKNDYSAVFFRHQDDDVNKDVIGAMFLTQNKDKPVPPAQAQTLPGFINDADMERLKDFPKLQALVIQNQKLSDAGIAKLAQFPHLTDVRFHYMDLFDLITPNFLLPLNALTNLRVLEYKHNFFAGTINVKGLNGFSNLQRLILDNGAATDDGLDFAKRCPNLQDFHFHRNSFTKAKFTTTVPTLTKLKLIFMRTLVKGSVDASWVEGFENLTELEVVHLDTEFDVPAIAAAVKNKIPGAEVIHGAAGAHVDRGYVLPVFTAFGKDNQVTIKTIPYMNY